MEQVRKGLFETNSSSSHSITIYYKNNSIYSYTIYDDDIEDEDLEFSDEDLSELLQIVPIEKLEDEIKRRKSNETSPTETI